MLDQIPDGETKEIVQLCTCFNARMLARLLTARYTEILKPSGLTPTQFSTLIALRTGGALPVSELADILGSDRTTLGRNLKPMERDGIVDIGTSDEDGRVRQVSITPVGQERLEMALPLWQRAQEEFGTEVWQSFHSLITKLSDEQ